MGTGMNAQLEQYRRWGMEAIYLTGCALKGTCPQPNPDMELSGLYSFCNFHSITSMTAMALEMLWKELPPQEPETMKPWKQAKEKAIRKNILLNAERETILGHLEQLGCWHMPLKGSLLQHDYPKFGMRQMSDNDILYDEAFQQAVYDYMTASGYEAVHYGKGNHDEYVRKPVYNMEMHKALFMASHVPALSDYYRDVRRLMKKDEGNRFGYHLSPEDFYVYLIAHAYKHYLYGGIGIRNLLDVYVYVTRHGDSLDWDYIFRELRCFGAEGFEAECRLLGQKLLSRPCRNPELNEREQQLLDLYFTAGTYGTQEKAVRNQVESSGKAGKLRYLLNRLFPSVQYMIDMEPELQKKRWKLPFAYLRRLLRGVFCRPRSILREFSLLNRTDRE